MARRIALSGFSLLAFIVSVSIATTINYPYYFYWEHIDNGQYGDRVVPLCSSLSSYTTFNHTIPVTVCSWIKPTSAAPTARTPWIRMPWYYGESNIHGFGLAQILATGKWGINWANTTQTSNVDVVIDQWVHICVAVTSFDPTTGTKLFINGVQQPLNAGPASWTPVPSTSTFCIGGEASFTSTWLGGQARVSFWNYERTPEEIQAEMKNIFLNDARLLRHWPLNIAAGWTTLDAVVGEALNFHPVSIPQMPARLKQAYLEGEPNAPYQFPWTCNNGVVDPWEQCDSTSDLCTYCENLWVSSRGKCTTTSNVFNNDTSHSGLFAVDGALMAEVTTEILPTHAPNIATWFTTLAYSTLVVDMEGIYTIVKIMLQGGTNYPNNDATLNSFTISASNFSTGPWTTIVSAGLSQVTAASSYNLYPQGDFATFFPTVKNIRARYVMLTAVNFTGSGASVAELEILTNDLPTYEVISQRANVSASGPQVFGPQFAVDGLVNDSPIGWQPLNVPASLTVDLGTSQTINGFRMQNMAGNHNWIANSNGMDVGTKDFHIGVSVDGLNFTTVLGGILRLQTYSDFLSQCQWWDQWNIGQVEARYVRFYIDSSYYTRGGLAEFQVLRYTRPPKNVLAGACITGAASPNGFFNSTSNAGFNIIDGLFGESRGTHFFFAPPPTAVDISLGQNYTVTRVVAQPGIHLPLMDSQLQVWSLQGKAGLNPYQILTNGNITFPDLIFMPQNKTRPEYHDGIRFSYDLTPTRIDTIKLWYHKAYACVTMSEVQALTARGDPNVPIAYPFREQIDYIGIGGSLPEPVELFNGIYNEAGPDWPNVAMSLEFHFRYPTLVDSVVWQNSAGVDNNHGMKNLYAFTFIYNDFVELTAWDGPDYPSVITPTSSTWWGPSRYCNLPYTLKFAKPVRVTSLRLQLTSSYNGGPAMSEVSIQLSDSLATGGFAIPGLGPIPAGMAGFVLPGQNLLQYIILDFLAKFKIYDDMGTSQPTVSAVNDSFISISFANPLATVGDSYRLSVIRADNHAVTVRMGPVVASTWFVAPVDASVNLIFLVSRTVFGTNLQEITELSVSTNGTWMPATINLNVETSVDFSFPAGLGPGPLRMRIVRNTYTIANDFIGRVHALPSVIPNATMMITAGEFPSTLTINLEFPLFATLADITMSLKTSPGGQSIPFDNLELLPGNKTLRVTLLTNGTGTEYQDINAQVSVFGGSSPTTTVAHSVPRPVVSPASGIYINQAPRTLTVTGSSFSNDSTLAVIVRAYSNTTFPYTYEETFCTNPILSTTSQLTCTFLIEFTGVPVDVYLEASVGAFGSFSFYAPIGSLVFDAVFASATGRYLSTNATQLVLKGFNIRPETSLILGILTPWEAVVDSTLYLGDADLAREDIWNQVDSNFTEVGFLQTTIRSLACTQFDVIDATTAICTLASGALPQTGFLFGQGETLDRVSPSLNGFAHLIPPPTTTISSGSITTTSEKLTLFGERLDAVGGTLQVSLSFAPAGKRRALSDPICVPILDVNGDLASSISCALNWSTVATVADRPTGSLYATVSSYGHTTAATQIATVLPAPSLTQAGQLNKVASNSPRLRIRGSNFLLSALESHYLTLSNGVFSSYDATLSTATELVCNVENLTVGFVDAQLTLFDGPASISNPQDAFPHIAPTSWAYVAQVIPPATIEPGRTSVSSSGQVVIIGTGFDDSSLSATTVFVSSADNAGGTPVACTVTLISPTRIACNVADPNVLVSSGGVLVRVDAYGGSTTSITAGVPAVPSGSDITTDDPLSPSIKGAIAAVVVIVSAIVAAIVIFVLVRRYRALKNQMPSGFEMGEKSTTIVKIDPKWEIPLSDLTIGKKIGKGGFGQVYKGVWRESRVAIKEAILETDKARTEFFHEADIMLKLRPHKNVVQTFGLAANLEAGTVYLVLELCYESLDKIAYSQDKRSQLTEAKIVEYARHIARGMLHLSREGIVHRDLSCRNVLLAKNGVPKICDFGMSRVTQVAAEGTTASTIGAIRWMAPESMSQRFSSQSDVWMYGCTLIELLTGRQPYPDQEILQIAIRVRDEGMHPEIQSDFPEIFQTILRGCFQFNPDDRYTFADISKMLGEYSNDAEAVAPAEETSAEGTNSGTSAPSDQASGSAQSVAELHQKTSKAFKAQGQGERFEMGGKPSAGMTYAAAPVGNAPLTYAVVPTANSSETSGYSDQSSEQSSTQSSQSYSNADDDDDEAPPPPPED